MSLNLKIIFAILIVLSLPGIAVMLYAGMVVASLIYAEIYPDPENIAHGMGMLALFPMIAWTLLALGYILCLWLIWLAARKIAKSATPIFKKSNAASSLKSGSTRTLIIKISPNKVRHIRPAG